MYWHTAAAAGCQISDHYGRWQSDAQSRRPEARKHRSGLSADAIGDGPCIADHVRCLGYRDPRLNRLSSWLRAGAARTRSGDPKRMISRLVSDISSEDLFPARRV